MTTETWVVPVLYQLFNLKHTLDKMKLAGLGEPEIYKSASLYQHPIIYYSLQIKGKTCYSAPWHAPQPWFQCSQAWTVKHLNLRTLVWQLLSRELSWGALQCSFRYFQITGLRSSTQNLPLTSNVINFWSRFPWKANDYNLLPWLNSTNLSATNVSLQ